MNPSFIPRTGEAVSKKPSMMCSKVTDAAAAVGAGTYVSHGPMNVKRAKTIPC